MRPFRVLTWTEYNDDAALAGSLHARGNGASHQECAFHVHVVDRVPLRIGDALERLRHLTPYAACDMDQHIDVPRSRLGFTDQGRNRIGIGYVKQLWEDVPARPGTRLIRLLRQDIGGKDRGAARCKALHDPAADAAGGAGHDHDAPIKVDVHAG